MRLWEQMLSVKITSAAYKRIGLKELEKVAMMKTIFRSTYDFLKVLTKMGIGNLMDSLT